MDAEAMAMHIVKNYDQRTEPAEMREAIAVAIVQGYAKAETTMASLILNRLYDEGKIEKETADRYFQRFCGKPHLV